MTQESATKKYSNQIVGDLFPKNTNTNFHELYNTLTEIMYELSQESNTPDTPQNEYERGYWLGAQHMLSRLWTHQNLREKIE